MLHQKIITKMRLLILLGLFTISFGQDCSRMHKKIGCFWSDGYAKVLFNDRSSIHVKNNGTFERLACKCNAVARSNGFKFFALRNIGICIGYNKITSGSRSVESCIDTKTNGTCNLGDPTTCAGRYSNADMIYEIVPEKCHASHTKIGCYVEDKNATFLFNDRRHINWQTYEKFLKELACKCNVVALESGFKYFGIRFYGICVGINKIESKEKPRYFCKDPNYRPYRPCNMKDKNVCTGDHRRSDMVYKTERQNFENSFKQWSSWSGCSKSCGGGSQKRTRECKDSSICLGGRTEFKSCSNDFCRGSTGVAKAQEVVETFLEKFHRVEFPKMKPSGKYLKAIFEIQKAVGEEFTSVDPSVKGVSLDKRLTDLEKFLKIAVEGGSIDFARSTLGKGLFVFMKKKIKEGLPIVDIDTAAKGFLNKLTGDIGTNKMNEILSSKGDATLMFTIDTTGSMSAEINAAKAIARQIISATRDFQVDYILSPFNDPSTGPVTYRSTGDRARFVSDINSLRAHGGGDCPELAIKGMLNAFDRGPKYGSPMFVFTDASPKDNHASNMAALKAAASSNNAKITFFTNLKGCGGTNGIESYKEIASHTGGQIFPLKNEAELIKFTDYVKSSLQQDTIIATGGSLSSRITKRSVPRSHNFMVDQSLTRLIISVAFEKQNAGTHVTLLDPNNNKISSTTMLAMSMIYDIKKPKTGVWKLTFPHSVGQFGYNVQAVTSNAIEFAHNFLLQDNVKGNKVTVSLENPIKGITNMMVIRLGGADHLDLSTIKVHLLDQTGNPLISNIDTDPLDSDEIRNASIVPPAAQFKVLLTGKTKSGQGFQRMSQGSSTPVTAFMRTISAGYDFTATIAKDWTSIQMVIVNKGSTGSFNFQAKTKYGVLRNANQSKNIKKEDMITFSYKAPNNNALKGKTDTITVIAKTPSGDTINHFISILLIN